MTVQVVPVHRAARARARVPEPVRWVGRVLAWLVILTCLSAVAVGVLVPRLVGGTPYTILTGSMQPRMPPGTLVVDRPATAADIGIGTVVTYQITSGEPTVVTHRVVAVQSDLQGHLTYTTRGDANSVADAAPVRFEQIRGVRWYYVPYLGYLSNWITGSDRQKMVDVVAVGLGLYALAMFAGAARERRRPRSVEAPVVEADRVREPA